MHVLVTGGTGLVGRFVVADLLAGGNEVTLLGRHALPEVAFRRWELGGAAPIPAADALVHCALDHQPGRYRGGEGADPEGFWERNVTGSLRLFAAAREAGVQRGVFLSSRAVYGDARPGAILDEADAPMPDTLYGRAKLAVEAALPAFAESGLAIAALRATGVYGLCAGSPEHKWRALFAGWLRGAPVASRAATEVHGADLASAVALLLAAPIEAMAGRALNASDLLLDQHDLLSMLGSLVRCAYPVPPRADASTVSVMATDRLRALGWRPGGSARLAADLTAMAEIARGDVTPATC